MQNIYWLLFFAVIICEFSPYMNTKNIIKKASLILIAVGCALKADHKELYLIEIGSLVFFSTCTIRSFLSAKWPKKLRRATD